MQDVKSSTPQTSQTTPSELKVDPKIAKEMARHFKSGKVKKDGFWVKYNANYLREVLKDETITEVKFIAAANLDDQPKKNTPTILIQLKRLATLITTYDYIDTPAEVCPPPEGVCDTDGSIEN